MSTDQFNSRFAFVQSKGVSGKNTRAWSFANHAEKFVIFGAWTEHQEGSRCLILADHWRIRNNRVQGGFTHSRGHIDLILEEGYKLFTFPQTAKPRSNDDEPSKIKSWKPRLDKRELLIESGKYFAIETSVTHPLQTADAVPTETTNNHETFWEGNETSKLTTQYERNPEARQKCLDEYGYSCQACEFDFAKVYGQLGEQFIHVHHLIPVSARKKPYRLNPKTDLIPLCPNCHAMSHKRIPPYSIGELQQIIEMNRTS